ncbi:MULTISPECIES: carbon-nitrogen hydrolase family protein [Pseudomonas]|uniref:Carbon-nitrogen hydrolase family protein n=1 Tax=Pseudomonas quercus TaxID=2722792 RepID=A0ABX0YET6_9PSED|nr:MULTISPECIES: carbon-nitrogen hydrolase family protein [Pseudomonas]MBF7143053.1 carbon-nitrogen hydrolase family protein [Pseudomonas sp. LY10J]NJP01918.1 carbon-nitrogen hydrolase family protein [Pseudomonas quercus]
MAQATPGPSHRRDISVCAAQYCAVAGNIEANIARHEHFMRQAAQHQVAFLLFPELSLTGYEPSLAAQLALPPGAPCLQPLRVLARQLRMTTAVGLPVRLAGQSTVMVGALVLGADGSQALYTKQHLHEGEDAVFSPGTGGALVEVSGEPLALSVCADFTHASHAQAAARAGADIYAASVLISEAGYAKDSALLQGYAAAHPFGVLMANHGGPSGGWACAGRSAFWAPGGRLVMSAAGTGDCLVIARRQADVWEGEVLAVQAGV